MDNDITTLDDKYRIHPKAAKVLVLMMFLGSLSLMLFADAMPEIVKGSCFAFTVTTAFIMTVPSMNIWQKVQVQEAAKDDQG